MLRDAALVTNPGRISDALLKVAKQRGRRGRRRVSSAIAKKMAWGLFDITPYSTGDTGMGIMTQKPMDQLKVLRIRIGLESCRRIYLLRMLSGHEKMGGGINYCIYRRG